MTTRRVELPQARTTRTPGGFNHVGSLIQLEQLATFIDRGRAAQSKVDRLTSNAPLTPRRRLEQLEAELHATLSAAAPIAYRDELRAPLVRLLRRARRVLRELEGA